MQLRRLLSRVRVLRDQGWCRERDLELWLTQPRLSLTLGIKSGKKVVGDLKIRPEGEGRGVEFVIPLEWDCALGTGK